MTPAEMTATALRIARSYTYVREATPNRGEAVDEFIRGIGLDPAGRFPWCMAYVYHVVRQAVATNPLPKTGSVQAAVEWAKGAGVLRPEPAPGTLAVFWHPELKRFGHIGFVIAPVLARRKNVIGPQTGAPTGKWATVEGNTSDPSRPPTREGWGCFERERTFTPSTQFIYWQEKAL